MRLQFVRNNQKTLRAEVYRGLKDVVSRGDLQGNVVGKHVILPATFTGSARFLFQNYQDAMAICRHYGYLDLFITFTCNAKWLEINEALCMVDGQQAQDRPNIVSRVFKLKLQYFMDNLIKKKHFGPVSTVTYTIEFQKRGLPHVHILLWLESTAKCKNEQDVNRIISAEIPNKELDPIGYEVVSNFMIWTMWYVQSFFSMYG